MEKPKIGPLLSFYSKREGFFHERQLQHMPRNETSLPARSGKHEKPAVWEGCALPRMLSCSMAGVEGEESEMSDYYVPTNEEETIKLLRSGKWQVERLCFNDSPAVWRRLTIEEILKHAERTGVKKMTAIVGQAKQGVLL